MSSPDRFIASCRCWSDFWDRTTALASDVEKGNVFERLTQLYLETVPEYRAKLERNKARLFARRLHLASSTAWREYWKSHRRPADIPANPDSAYVGLGGISWGDWLGTGRIYKGNWRPFKKARAFARKLGLSSQADWNEYWNSHRKPKDIPAYPNEIYANVGWSSWGDWLGTKRVANQRRKFRHFTKAREYALRVQRLA